MGLSGRGFLNRVESQLELTALGGPTCLALRWVSLCRTLGTTIPDYTWVFVIRGGTQHYQTTANTQRNSPRLKTCLNIPVLVVSCISLPVWPTTNAWCGRQRTYMFGRQRALVLADNDSLYCEVSSGSNLNDYSNWIEPTSCLAIVVVSVGACLSVLLSLPSSTALILF